MPICPQPETESAFPAKAAESFHLLFEVSAIQALRHFRLAAVLLPILVRIASASLASDKPLHQFTLQHWQSAQGLPQNSVLSIAQTHNGYLWLGTEEGLARFDGVRFTNFDRQNSGLDQNIVQTLLVDHRGVLWAGTQGGGLNRFDGQRFYTFDADKGLPKHAITALYEDASGVLWIGTDGGGLARMQGGKFKVFEKQDGLADNSVFSITGDRQGNLWIGTHGGLSRWSAGRFTGFYTSDGLPSNHVRTVKADRQGNVWVGTPSGLSRISANGITNFTTKDGLANNSIYSLFEDRSGTLWIGAELGGLCRLVNGRITSYADDSGFLANDIWSIFEDREGNLWTGSAGHGLTSLKQGLFTTLTIKDGLPSNTILPVLEDTDGALWIGSDAGLARREKNQTTLLTVKDGLPHNLVLSLAQDRTGAIWAGTKHGLAQIKGGKVATINTESKLPSDAIMALYVDHAGNLWIGTRNGLFRFDGRNVTTFTTKEGLSSNHVLHIQEDRKGAIWIGTFGGGLNRFQGGVFHAYTTLDGLSSNVINSIYSDAAGVLWLAANNGGLNRWEDGKISTFAAAPAMYQDSIFQILEDSRGYLWLTSNKGVFRYSKQQLNDFAAGRNHEISSSYYDTAEGMGSRECNGGFQPAGWKDKNGRFYIPTAGGLAFTDRDLGGPQDQQLQAVLENISIDDRAYPLGQTLTVPPGKGRLQFQFTAPSFLAPEKLRFRYMLEGFDRDWVDAGSQRTAYYTNIPHGEYHFHVQVGTGESWKEKVTTPAITLQPHFYQTRVFYFLIFFLAFTVCAAAYRIRVDQLKQREQKLRELVDERTAALRESERQLRRSRDELEIRVQERTQELTYVNTALGEEVETRRRTEEQLIVAKEAAEAASLAKTDFLTNMSHEIRTPINGILGMTEITLSTDLDDEQKEYLDLVKLSADSLLLIVNDILDFSEIEQKRLTLTHTPFQLKPLLDELSVSFEEKAKAKNLSFLCRFSPDIPDGCIGDPLRLRKVLLNLLDNAVKFTAKGGIILSGGVDRLCDGVAELHFTIRDTGIGIAPEMQKTIFEAFTQADTSLTRQYGGTGLGLTVSSGFALMMGGSIWVESQLGEGSTFHFTARITVDPASGETQGQTEPAMVSA